MIVVAARIILYVLSRRWRAACLQPSDLQCLFFVACESKRLQASGFAAGDCRQMLLYVYRCFERARLRLKSPLVDKKSLESKCYSPSLEHRLSDESCRSPQTSCILQHWELSRY